MNDLERVTKQAYAMVAYAGMSDRLSNLCYYNNQEYSFTRPYSEKTAEAIDNEVHKMITEQYERAKELLRKHKEGHAELARILMEKEVIFAEDVEKIFGKRPWASRSEEIINESKEDNTGTAESTENTASGTAEGTTMPPEFTATSTLGTNAEPPRFIQAGAGENNAAPPKFTPAADGEAEVAANGESADKKENGCECNEKTKTEA